MNNFIRLTSVISDDKEVFVKASEVLVIEDFYDEFLDKNNNCTLIKLTNGDWVKVKECAGVVKMMLDKCLSE